MQSKDYVLGIDIGVTSVGWGVIDHEHNIVDAGVRLFEEANASNNEDRRNKRGARRVKRRRKQRIVEMKRLLLREGLIDKDFAPYENPYEIRVQGLRRKLSNEELATALLHLVKRRGSSLDVIEDDEQKVKEDQKAKKQLSKNARKMWEEKKHVCEIQLERLRQRGHIRGEDNIFQTDDYKKEAKAILENQDVSKAFIDDALELIVRKRHYSEGPGSKTSPTPYGRWRYDENGQLIEVDLIEEMRGKCSVYPEEKRAPKESFSAELFNFLNDLNNIKINSREEPELSKEEKEAVIAIIRKQGHLTPKTNQPKALANILDVEIEEISGFRTDTKNNPIMTEFKGYKKLLKEFKKHNASLKDQDETLDAIAEILTAKKQKSERIEAFQDLGLAEDLADSLSELPGFTQYHSLSLKAIREINGEMLLTSKNQMEIITENNLVQQDIPDKLTLNEDAILSPVAKRAHRETLKVIEALTKKYGHFDKIVLETTRAKNSAEERQMERRRQDRNRERNKEVEELLEDYGEQAQRVKGQKALKVRLYKEQNGKCAYSYNPLSLDDIVNDRDTYEIDHIIPYSVSMDNSYHNKVLCEGRANQFKGNKTPFMYFKSGKAYGAVKDFDTFKNNVLQNPNYSRKKKEMLLREEDVTKFDMLKEFTARNLVDTSYAIRTLMTTIKQFYKHHNIPTKVFTVRGQVTNLFRNIGASAFLKDHPNIEENPLDKSREVYKHHAIDALIAARLSEQKLIRKLMRLDRTKDIDEDTGEVLYEITPLEDRELVKFVKHLAEFDEDDFKYSWKVDKKPNRAFSDETIYSTRIKDNEEYLVKKHKDIYNMESKDLKKKLFKDNKTKEKILMYHNDPQTFEKMEKTYEQYKHEKYPFAAYKEEHGPIRKHSKNGNGPLVKQIKYLDAKVGSHLDISDKYPTGEKRVVLKQISPYRTDFYKNPDGKIKFVTIKFAEMEPVQGENPFDIKEFIIPNDLYHQKKQAKKIDGNAEFLHSFNRNEIIEIVSKEKDAIQREQGRFIGTNNDTTGIIEIKTIEAKDAKQEKRTIGRKTVDVKKYAVSPIGDMKKVDREQLKLRVRA